MSTKTKTYTLMLLISAVAILTWSPCAQAQEEPAPVALYTGKSVNPHPDGALGSVSFHGLFQYAAVNKGAGVTGPDIKNYHFGLCWVVSDRVSLDARFLTTDEDSLRYESTLGLSLYTRRPTQKGISKNPDGCVGGLVARLAVGARYPNLTVETSRLVGDIGATLPVSRRLTLLAGYRYFEGIEPVDVAQFYSGLNLYLAPYSADSAYANPDGPVGLLAVSLTGGGSGNGVFGDLTLLFPISNKLTWKLNIRGERVESPYRRSAFGGAGFSFYPAN